MKTGEIIGIAGGATVLGGIVWFIYRKTKGVQLVDPLEYKNYKTPEYDTLYAGGATRARSTKKTHNNNNNNNNNNKNKGTKKRC
jgi:hypothetical protein